jgi:hypothetical protein
MLGAGFTVLDATGKDVSTPCTVLRGSPKLTHVI